MYPNLVMKNFLADGAMDNYPTYKLLQHYDMNPFIQLDSNAKYPDEQLPKGVLCFDDIGPPICMGGIPYKNCGYSYPKGIKYRCWFDYYGIDKPCNCSDSNYGRTLHIKPDYDPRLFSPVFKEMFKRRTSVERSNKRILVDYNIESGRCRSSKQRFVRATLAAINIHLDAWIKHTGFHIMSLLTREITA